MRVVIPLLGGRPARPNVTAADTPITHSPIESVMKEVWTSEALMSQLAGPSFICSWEPPEWWRPVEHLGLSMGELCDRVEWWWPRGR